MPPAPPGGTAAGATGGENVIGAAAIFQQLMQMQQSAQEPTQQPQPSAQPSAQQPPQAQAPGAQDAGPSPDINEQVQQQASAAVRGLGMPAAIQDMVEMQLRQQIAQTFPMRTQPPQPPSAPNAPDQQQHQQQHQQQQHQQQPAPVPAPEQQPQLWPSGAVPPPAPRLQAAPLDTRTDAERQTDAERHNRRALRDLAAYVNAHADGMSCPCVFAVLSDCDAARPGGLKLLEHQKPRTVCQHNRGK